MTVTKNLFARLGAYRKDNFRLLFWQFFKFGLVGVSNTAISMSCYYLFLWIDPRLYLAGGVVGGVVSIANAFFWNDRFVFRSEKRDFKSVLKRLGRTYAAYGGTSLFGFVLLWTEVQILGLNRYIVPVINLAITVPMNFLINKLWTFRTRKI